MCHHIDDIHPSRDHLPSLSALKEHSVSSLFEAALGRDDANKLEQVAEQMDVEDTETRGAGNDEEAMDIEMFATSIIASESMDTLESVDVSNARSVSRARRLEAREAVELSRKALEVEAAKQLDVDGIVRSCVHPAAAMLRDRENCRQRKMTRLQLLLELLNHKKLTQVSVVLRCNAGLNLQKFHKFAKFSNVRPG